MLRSIFYATLYQLKVFFRIKEAIFFSIIFPVLLFILFSYLWGENGNDKYYINQILTGIVGMTVMSDGLFAVGSVLKEYYETGFLKQIKHHPYSIIHFLGFIIARLLSIFATIIILSLIAILIFKIELSGIFFIRQFFSSILGLFLFSFIGLNISFGSLKAKSAGSFNNLFYFVTIFTSSVFYPIESLNKTIAKIGNYLPLEALLTISRGEIIDLICLIFWIISPILLFMILFKNLEITR